MLGFLKVLKSSSSEPSDEIIQGPSKLFVLSIEFSSLELSR
ncbi:MAG: hypothetical protein ACJAWA_000036 [Nonlabens sp.]|jgi:hypothetical protein